MTSRKIREFRYALGNFEDLNNNAAHNFAQQHALQLYRVNSVYTFIPKNACSSFRLSLAYWNGCISSKNDHNWIHLNNYTFGASLKSLAEADYVFTVLRCPFKRLASCFLDKLCHPLHGLYYRQVFMRNTLSNPRSILRKLNRKAILKYDDFRRRILCRDNTLDFTFSDFVHQLALPSVLNSDIHWKPQVSFLVYKNYDDYFALENLGKAAAQLSDRLGFTLLDARSLTNHGLDGFKKVEGNFSSVTCREIIEMKERACVPDYASMYNENLISRVTRLYSDDLKEYKSAFGANHLTFK